MITDSDILFYSDRKLCELYFLFFIYWTNKQASKRVHFLCPLLKENHFSFYPIPSHWLPLFASYYELYS